MADKKADKPAEVPKKRVAAKLFEDVKKPEDTLAAATSKPVIVGHRSTIKDPMVSEEKAAENSSESTPELESPEEFINEKPKNEIKIQPINEDLDDKTEKSENKGDEEKTTENPDEQITEDAKTEESKSEEEESEQENNPDKAEKQTKDAEESGSETLPTPDETNEDVKDEDAPLDAGTNTAVDSIVENISTQKERDQEAEKQQVVENEVSELITSKKYNVKIRSAPNKRKAKALIIFLILAILAGAGWYFGYGPGKDMWIADTSDSSTVTPIADKSDSSQANTKDDKTDKDLIAFTNPDISLTFSYPKTWKVEVAKDEINKDFDVITLISPVHQIDSIVAGAPTVKTDAFLRTKIIVQANKPPSDQLNKLVDLTSCSSEDLVIDNKTYKLVYSDQSGNSPNISKVNLSLIGCKATGQTFAGNDQIQFTNEAESYVIYSEYVFSEEALAKNGITEPTAIKQAQENGVLTTKSSFKATESYTQLIETLKTLKEL